MDKCILMHLHTLSEASTFRGWGSVSSNDSDYIPISQGLRHRGGGGDGGTRPPIFESAGDNPPIFRNIVGQIRRVFGFWYGLPSEENPGFAAAWSPSPPIFIGVAEPLLSANIILKKKYLITYFFFPMPNTNFLTEAQQCLL